MRKKYDRSVLQVKEDSETTIKLPEWIRGENQRDDIQSCNQNRHAIKRKIRSKSCNGYSDEYDNNTERKRRSNRNENETSEIHTQRNREDKRRKKTILDERTRNEQRINISLESIRQSLTDDDLKNLLNRTYKPNKIIPIIQIVNKSKFAEDFYMEKPIKKIKRVKGKTPKKSIPPSEQFIKNIEICRSEGSEPTAEIVLYYYFNLYKQYFHEEDPEWTGKSTNKAIEIINKFAIEVTDKNYRTIINFVRKIFPLWVDRLKQEENFPSNRPTIQSLFENSRYFWTNRNILYRRWERK